MKKSLITTSLLLGLSAVFTLERKSISKHRLEFLYKKDYNELKGFIKEFDSVTNVLAGSGGSGNSVTVNVNITIEK